MSSSVTAADLPVYTLSAPEDERTVPPASYGLFLFSHDADVRRSLKSHLSTMSGRDSGFDLSLYADDDTDADADADAGNKMLTTRVYAKVIHGSVPLLNHYSIDFNGFDLRLRSSVPKQFGWFLGNGVGTIDAGYCGELKAYMFKSSARDATPWRDMCGKRIVQIVAPDLRPFYVVRVYDDQQKWDAMLLKYKSKDRRGGFGSTNV